MLIKKQKQITLREMQDTAKTTYEDDKGLFKESEVSAILTELSLGSTRSIRKIVRECGKFATKYRDLDSMLDTITDFFIDNEKNFLQANSVLNGRTYNPLENYDRQEEAYTDSSSETHGIGARGTTVTRGKVKTTDTPGKVKTTSTDIEKPAVVGLQASGSTGNKVKEISNTTETEQLAASTVETEQLAADSTSQAAAEDTIAKQDVHAARRTHGNIGVTTAQQMATAELQFINKFANTLDFIIYLFKQNCVIPVYLDDVNEYGYHYDIQGDPFEDAGEPNAYDPGANPSTNPEVTPTPVPSPEGGDEPDIPDGYTLMHVYGDFVATDINKNTTFSYVMALDGEHKESHMLVRKGTQMTFTNEASGSYDFSLSYAGTQWDSVETVSGNLNKNIVASTDQLIVYIGVEAKTKESVPKDMLPDMTQYHTVNIYPWIQVDLVLGASTIGTGIVNLTASSGRPVDNMKSSLYEYKWCLPNVITTAILTSTSYGLTTINVDGVFIASGSAAVSLNSAKNIILNDIPYSEFTWLCPSVEYINYGTLYDGPFVDASLLGTQVSPYTDEQPTVLPYDTRIRLTAPHNSYSPRMWYTNASGVSQYLSPPEIGNTGVFLLTVDRDFWLDWFLNI